MNRASNSRAAWPEPLFRHPAQLDLFCRVQGCTPACDGREPPPLACLQTTTDRIRDIYPRVRGGVVCMVSAAQIHSLLSAVDDTLWLGVPLRTHVPRRDPSVLRTLRWSNRPAFEVGVGEVGLGDLTILCTTPERTVVDLFRYGRHLGGSATAAHCLWAYTATGGSHKAICDMADAVRIPRPARLILDALLSAGGPL